MLILTFLLVAAAAGEHFDPGRVHLLQHYPATNSFLFRSNEPTYSNDTFDYAGLLATMRTVANASGVTLPASPYLVDYNLLTLERGDIEAEKRFFAANPSKGVFVSRPTWGSLVNPFSLPEPVRKEMAKTLSEWSHDKLPKRMEELYTMLTQTYRNTAIFIHCEAGEDRTGEVSGAYYIRHLNYSFHEALAIDNSNEHRDIRCMSAHELMWYCLELHYNSGGSFPNLGSCEPVNTTYCS